MFRTYRASGFRVWSIGSGTQEETRKKCWAKSSPQAEEFLRAEGGVESRNPGNVRVEGLGLRDGRGFGDLGI